MAHDRGSIIGLAERFCNDDDFVVVEVFGNVGLTLNVIGYIESNVSTQKAMDFAKEYIKLTTNKR